MGTGGTSGSGGARNLGGSGGRGGAGNGGAPGEGSGGVSGGGSGGNSEARSGGSSGNGRDASDDSSPTLADARTEVAPTDAMVGADSRDVAGSRDVTVSPDVAQSLDEACTPALTLRLADATGQVFLDAMGGTAASVEAIVQSIGRDVCRVLYRKPEEVRAANSIELVIRDYDGVAAKSGDLGRIKVEMSTRHLQNVKAQGRDVAREIKGMLYHEITHMYQHDDRPEGTWSGLPNYYEAGADAVRIRYGYVPSGCQPRKSGQWYEHRYCSGGYWWLWVDTKHPGFLYKLNNLMRGRDMRAFDVADATAIAGKSLDDLWKEYQGAACCSESSTACCR
ncbi:MAG TPA: basic secretory protein-like protein [Polyangia bacterium]